MGWAIPHERNWFQTRVGYILQALVEKRCERCANSTMQVFWVPRQTRQRHVEVRRRHRGGYAQDSPKNPINHYFGYHIRILRGRFTLEGFYSKQFFEILLFLWIWMKFGLPWGIPRVYPGISGYTLGWNPPPLGIALFFCTAPCRSPTQTINCLRCGRAGGRQVSTDPFFFTQFLEFQPVLYLRDLSYESTVPLQNHIACSTSDSKLIDI